MIITNIQRMSMDDGPGIRTTVFVKGCPLRCRWCHNPECLEPEATVPFSRNFSDSFVYDGNAKALCDRLAKDRHFFTATGGGVTISGGEPLLYPGFVESVGKELSRRGISLAVDTCGCVPWSSFESTLPFTELYLYDLKTSDSGLHERLTGQKNERIWENLDRLLAYDKKIRVRIPVIKNANSSELEKIVKRLPLHKNITAVELLPYHKYGIGKYRDMEMDYPGKSCRRPEEARVRSAAAILKEKGIRCFYLGKEDFL